MTTFADLQNEVLLQLEGFSNDQVVMAKVGGAGINASDTSITVTGGTFSDGSGMSTGVWEIEDELVFVPDFNRTTGVASNVIRGWRGTTASTHAVNAVIRNNPRFPYVQVRKTINDTVRNLFPQVPAVKTSDLTLQTRKVRYALPSEVKAVLSVMMQDLNDDNAWNALRVWRFDPLPGGTLDGGTAIELPYEGRSSLVRIVYAAEPSPMSAESDNFETTTGLPSFAREAVVWGALWRMYSLVELGRGAFSSADQTMLNRNSDFGKATEISKYLLGMYQQAVASAENRMQDLLPAQRHYVWG